MREETESAKTLKSSSVKAAKAVKPAKTKKSTKAAKISKKGAGKSGKAAASGATRTSAIPAAAPEPVNWQTLKQYEEIKYEFIEGIAKITINRPHKHNAFTPLTVQEMIEAMELARQNPNVRVVVLTGAGDRAFCSGGDQSVRGVGGYVGTDQVPRLNVLDLQRQIRSIPKPVIAMVAGWAIGGGHVLHVVCDLTIAADNARFGQTGPKVGSFDGGFGASYLARIVGQKKAREIWYLCEQYDAAAGTGNGPRQHSGPPWRT